jgi:hypothetical protein
LRDCSSRTVDRGHGDRVGRDRDQLPAGTGEEDTVLSLARRAVARAIVPVVAVVPALCLLIEDGAKRWL